LILDLILIGLVMTNDLHGIMFKMDLSRPGWSSTGNYSYGLLYFIVMSALLLQLIAGIIVIFTKIKHSPLRFGVIFPLGFIAALIGYMVGYVLNIPVFTESDMTLIICMFALLFLEISIRAGQIPVNTHYRSLFKNAGLNLQITDESGASAFTSKDAEPLDTKLWERLKNSGAPIHIDENTLLLKNKISGGYAVWRENIYAINKLKAEIEISSRQLEDSNRLLSNIARAKEKESQINPRRMLYAAFEKNIAGYEQKLTQMLRSVPADDSEIPAYMGTVAILVCYVKRQFNLLISEINGNETISFNEFVVYIDELAELARLTGTQFIICCDLRGEIGTRQAILFYDFFHSVMEWTITGKNPGSLVNIMSADGVVCMNLMSSAESMNYNLPEKTSEEIRAAGGLFTKDDQEDIAVLRLSLPERTVSGGGEHNA
ncbi:MAG: hypothetical protein FWD23_15190, partial [Oscillospiraceae bacterium]|nr:hypothetical protein [Oscillospiraceae bacterium]